MNDVYLESFVQRLCAEDDDIAEQGITIVERAGTLVVCGCVASEERRRLIGGRLAAELPDRIVRNELKVLPARPPDHVEELA